MTKIRYKELLVVGLGNVVSGIFFGTGCIIVEHVDNTWLHPETVAEETVEPKHKSTAIIKKATPVDNTELADADDTIVSN
jgi:hypothetical protein